GSAIVQCAGLVDAEGVIGVVGTIAAELRVIEAGAGAIEKERAGVAAIVGVELNNIGPTAPLERAIGPDADGGDVNAVAGGAEEVFSIDGHAGDVVREGRA